MAKYSNGLLSCCDLTLWLSELRRERLVDKGADKGEVKIAYSSFEQLDDLIRRLKNAR